MSRPVVHIYIDRPGPFGGTLHTTLCGRMALPTEKPFDFRNRKCKLCALHAYRIAAVQSPESQQAKNAGAQGGKENA